MPPIPSVTPQSPVRVRFCPSPTGVPHVGLIRTALFNWAYARHRHGTLVVRIEDTDAARDSETSYQQLLEALRWLGIDWDEGVEVGGAYGPYRQSQRGEIYREVMTKLRATGHVYESYSTPEEIESRHRAAGRDPKLGYDGYDRTLTRAQIATFQAEGRQPALRMRMPDEELQFTDLVRGEVSFPAGSIPDYVLVRPNGDPLYTFVNPLDDALMKVTHVLRGEDLLSSTPRQIALYRALHEIGVASHQPEFGHLPYVMGQGNKKLSKRDPESNLLLLREWGYIREGLLNYVALLGWSLSADEDIFTMDQLRENFDVREVVSNPARFDLKKAQAINATHIRRLETAEFRDRLIPYLHQAGLVGESLSPREEYILTHVAPLVQERVQVLTEAVEMLRFFFVDDEQLVIDADALTGLPENLGAVMDCAMRALEALEGWEQEVIAGVLRQALVEEMGLKPRLAFGPVRTAISGRRVSPPLFESLEILGRSSALVRMRRFRREYGQGHSQ